MGDRAGFGPPCANSRGLGPVAARAVAERRRGRAPARMVTGRAGALRGTLWIGAMADQVGWRMLVRLDDGALCSVAGWGDSISPAMSAPEFINDVWLEGFAPAGTTLFEPVSTPDGLITLPLGFALAVPGLAIGMCPVVTGEGIGVQLRGEVVMFEPTAASLGQLVGEAFPRRDVPRSARASGREDPSK